MIANVFHISDGFTIQRIESVGFEKDGQPYAFVLRVYSCGGHPEGALLAQTFLTESQLASVMATCSRRGESGETWREALTFLEATPAE